MKNQSNWRPEMGPDPYHLHLNLSIAGKKLVLRIPPILLFLTLACGFVSYHVANSQALSERERQAARIASLEQEIASVNNLLKHKSKEQEQLVWMAEARSEELWAELDERDRELARLWSVVRDVPALEKSPASPFRRSLVGSRGGSRRGASALRVKVEYDKLDSEFEKHKSQTAQLSQAAHAYRQQKIEEYKKELANRTPSLNPCEGEMTSGFGYRLHPVYGGGAFHGGCDFTVPHGTLIRATAAGTVTHSDWLGGYGKVVEIDHGKGLKTLYAHCSELEVKKGDKVSKGQKIAEVGTTGLSSGPHCHYEVRRGEKQIDPSPYLPFSKARSQKDALTAKANS